MKILFVHQNFPGQYQHLARHLASVGHNDVVFLTQRVDGYLPGVRKLVYSPQRKTTPAIHPYVRETEAGVLNAQAVTRLALELRASGFVPDVMLGHNGWGEIWYLKEVFPDTPLIGYFEFFYRLRGSDLGFAPGSPATFDDGPRTRTKNLGNLLGLDVADTGQCPTEWQKAQYPAIYHPKLQVLHDGIDTRVATPNPQARFTLPTTLRVLTPLDEVVTYVARNLEPHRGFPSLMRSLPDILQQRPQAQVLIVGADGISYGQQSLEGLSYREILLQEVGASMDLQRVHFLGRIPYATYLQVLQVSTAHIYLSYPFVLSWSMLEAMSTGCIVIGSRTPPVQEVIRDGENGILVDMFSPQDIGHRVVSVLADPLAFSSMRERARQTILDRHDLDTICLPAQLRLLNHVIGSR